MTQLKALTPYGLLAMLAMLATTACNETSLKGTSERLNPTVYKEFTQDDYPVTSVAHTQGHRGDPGEQNFEQGEWGALDVLVVIDNSGSMREEQANLASKLDPLLARVAKADWRIAVATTDPRDGCQEALINKGDADATSKFQNAIVTAGTSGNGVERPFLQAVNGLKCQGGDWVRDGSTVVVLIVTDEDNCLADASIGYDKTCAKAADFEATYVSSYLASIRTIGKDAKVYGIYRKPGDTACTTALGDATKVHELVTATSGKFGSICDGNYTTTLQAISEDVAQIVKYEFDLSHLPDDGTLKILVNGVAWTKYALEGKKVRFTETPPFGAKIEVNYRHGKSGELNTAFPVEKAPVDDSFVVKVDGTALPPGTYRWNENTKLLELDSPPAERAKVEIDYKEKTPLNAKYDIGTKADPKTLVVLVDDKSVKDFSYDAASGMVTLATPAAALAKVKISFKEFRD